MKYFQWKNSTKYYMHRLEEGSSKLKGISIQIFTNLCHKYGKHNNYYNFHCQLSQYVIFQLTSFNLTRQLFLIFWRILTKAPSESNPNPRMLFTRPQKSRLLHITFSSGIGGESKPKYNYYLSEGIWFYMIFIIHFSPCTDVFGGRKLLFYF